MPDSPAPKPVRNPEPLIRRLAARGIPLLLPRMVRLFGGGAIFGLPALMLGSRRFALLSKKYPFTLTAACLVLLAGAWAWQSLPTPHSAPSDYYSFNDFDEYSGLYTEDGPFYADTPLAAETAAAGGQAVSVQCEIKPLPHSGIATVGFEKSQSTSTPSAAPSAVTPVVWLTGDIEEQPLRSPDASRSGPGVYPRSASQHPSSRR